MDGSSPVVVVVVSDDEYMVGNDNVVVPIAAIQLCGFMLGEPVVVRCGSKTFVKHVWPSDDLPLSNVYFSKAGGWSCTAILFAHSHRWFTFFLYFLQC